MRLRSSAQGPARQTAGAPRRLQERLHRVQRAQQRDGRLWAKHVQPGQACLDDWAGIGSNRRHRREGALQAGQVQAAVQVDPRHADGRRPGSCSAGRCGVRRRERVRDNVVEERRLADAGRSGEVDEGSAQQLVHVEQRDASPENGARPPRRGCPISTCRRRKAASSAQTRRERRTHRSPGRRRHPARGGGGETVPPILAATHHFKHAPVATRAARSVHVPTFTRRTRAQLRAAGGFPSGCRPVPQERVLTYLLVVDH
jgi:hypothetical protein